MICFYYSNNRHNIKVFGSYLESRLWGKLCEKLCKKLSQKGRQSLLKENYNCQHLVNSVWTVYYSGTF